MIKFDCFNVLFIEKSFKDRVADLTQKIGDFQNCFRNYVTTHSSCPHDYQVSARTTYNNYLSEFLRLLRSAAERMPKNPAYDKNSFLSYIDGIESRSTANCQQNRHDAIGQALVTLKGNGLLSLDQRNDLVQALADLETVDRMLKRIKNSTISHNTQPNFMDFGGNSGFFMNVPHNTTNPNNVPNDTTTNQNVGNKKSEESEKGITIEEVLNYCQKVDEQKKKNKRKKKKNKHKDETKVDTNNIQTEQDTVVAEYKKSINEHMDETMKTYGGRPKKIRPVISAEWLKKHCAEESLNSISQEKHNEL